MRKRLRKKYRLGEFAVPVIPIAFRTRELSDQEINDLMERFVTEAIEANKLQCGVGSGVDRSVWSGFIAPVAWPGKISADQRSAVEAWVAAETDIIEYVLGEITTDDMEPIMDRDPDYPASLLGEG